MNSELNKENFERIEKRIDFLKNKPIGTVFKTRSRLHEIEVVKEDAAIVRMYFVDPKLSINAKKSSGAMSAINIENPLDLSPTPYNQAMMSTLVWNNDPKRIYMAGFAGGRLALVFHYLFPNVVIESTDIDRAVSNIAERYFGIEYDARQKLFIEDGRNYLEMNDGAKYDIIILDVFRGTGFSPPHLSTIEFFELCKTRLNDNGVITMNLVESDSLFSEKIHSFQKIFENSYIKIDRTITLFGTIKEILSPETLTQKATEIDDKYGFSFPYVERIKSTFPLIEGKKHLSVYNSRSSILKDELHKSGNIKIPKDDPIFFNVGRNELCPCGSGKKFKKCHGR